ncbi:hypothetical protein GCM10010413_07930 [Promicromonospora sukumoe]|uniref:Uncharacterized protein n=1 Tax=Promicromonospora sukumoe TaxID=88382 RepID=A0A7W3J592_9MICO|nr:hypothetical protein [Promicromonospora sukumoe]MBA8806465.1 hypothetical protein [Promicromonospora sukumoe]
MVEQTQEPTAEQPPNQTLRLVLTWLVVTVPLAYGLFQTVRSVIPLFTG